MPSRHVSLHYHIVFSTNRHRRIIAEPWRQELHAYCEPAPPQANIREDYVDLLRLSDVEFDEKYLW